MTEGKKLHYQYTIRAGRNPEADASNPGFSIRNKDIIEKEVTDILQETVKRYKEMAEINNASGYSGRQNVPLTHPLEDLINRKTNALTVYHGEDGQIDAHIIDSEFYLRCFGAIGSEKQIRRIHDENMLAAEMNNYLGELVELNQRKYSPGITKIIEDDISPLKIE